MRGRGLPTAQPRSGLREPTALAFPIKKVEEPHFFASPLPNNSRKFAYFASKTLSLPPFRQVGGRAWEVV
jgi:hypothetical protein